MPDEVLCDRTRQSRATLNRRYGPRNDMTVTWMGDNLNEVQVLRPDAQLNDRGDLELQLPDGTWEVAPLRSAVRRRADDEE